MLVTLKALIVVLAIAAVIFWVGKPLALIFSNESDFSRRRNIWFVLTATAFLSPNFWVFAMLAAPVLFWAGRKDSNPLALYLLLLHVIPPIPVPIPVVGIKELFELDNYRLLSFCVLIPGAWRLRKAKDALRIRGLTSMDLSILAFGFLQLLIYVPPDLPYQAFSQDSATNVLRRGFLYLVDVYVLYFFASRSCCSRRALVDSMAAFCLAGAIMASVALFETFRSWLLYSNIVERWGEHLARSSLYGAYYFRQGFLRASASAGHALSLGYLLAIAFGFWLYLKTHVTSVRWRIVVPALFWLGLLASQARGGLLGAAAIYFVFALLGPRAVPGLLRSVIVAALVVSAASFTSFGQRIINSIPYFGHSTDMSSVDYRERLAERSWELIQLHPFLGDAHVMSKMEDLRQGEGIIDFVNAYAGIALFYGFVGLLVFLTAIILGLFKAYGVTKEMARRDPDYSVLGVSLVACLLGTLFIISSTSLIYGNEKMLYTLTGLAAAYAYLGTLRKAR